MKKILAGLVLIVLSASFAKAQHYSAKGTVTDIASDAKLKNASILILNAKDSTLYRFTRANTEGDFQFNNLKKGNFILLVSYPQYIDYVRPFALDSSQSIIDFKNIDLKTKAHLLNEVIIKGQATAIKIKGDTTEFNAAAYTIKPNDRVEDLLKQFSGIQVDAKGNITAQGKKVEKVLVDGEEFFGDDPTLVTKNLRADMVDKVQLFEKTSDQVAFTGIDDGQKKQTLNIVLKEDKKQGYFGKVDVGYGSQNFYEGQAMFNKFKKKEKIAAYGTLSNTAKTGLGWEDAGKYGSLEMGSMLAEGNAIIINSGGDDMEGGEFYGEGIPTARNGGIHYENKWKDDKHSLNTNYKIGALDIDLNKNSVRQTNLPTGILNYRGDELTNNHTFRQKIDATYQLKIDSSSNLKVNFGASLKHINTANSTNSQSTREDNSLLNTYNRSTSNEGKQNNYNFSALYMKKFKNVRRNISINLTEASTNSNAEGILKSSNNFYDNQGNLSSNELIDQLRSNSNRSNTLSTNITYNEPISKYFNAGVNYGISYIQNNLHKQTFDASLLDRYDQLNNTYTNHFVADQLINQAGLVFGYQNGKTQFNFGTKTNFVQFDQDEIYSGQQFNRSFVNWLPQAMYQYRFSNQQSISIRYNGSTTQPTMAQLQPVKTNDDPLNIQEGNPWLVPEFNSRFSIRYNSYKVLSAQGLYFSGNINFTHQAIVSDTYTDANGVSTFKSVNLTNHQPLNYSLFSSFSRKIKFLFGIELGTSLLLSGSTDYNYINNQLNINTNNTIRPMLGLSKFNDNGDFNFEVGPRYQVQESSMQSQYNNNGWGWESSLYLNYNLPYKVKLSSDFSYQYSPSSSSFANEFEQLIINAGLTKAFFKKEELKLRLTANDILNQNRGFDRSVATNAITQTSYNNIGRYFIFSLIWDFANMGPTAKTN